MKFIFSTVTMCAALIFAATASHPAESIESILSSYNIVIPDIEKQVGSGPVSGQQGTILNIDPSIFKLFPEASSLPTSINLSEWSFTMEGGTWNDLLSEWERRAGAQTQPVQPVSNQPLQTIGFGQTPGFQIGGLQFGGVTLPDAGFGGQALQNLQGLLPGVMGNVTIPSSWPQSIQGTLSTSGIYPWMSSYWTAQAALPQWQTFSDPLVPLLGPDAQSLGGTGIIP